MKSYTDLEQSKKLTEILPMESADGWWTALNWQETEYYIEVKQDGIDKPKKCIPCWSLAALLSVLPIYELNNFGDTIQLDVKKEALATEGDETLLDLVVNMIIHLHEQKLL